MTATTPHILNDFELSDEQRAAAQARGRDVVVTAGAGTGKTRTLVARFLALLEDDYSLRRIVAVTFTRKAAREMRNRVRQEIARYLERADLDDETAARWRRLYNEELDAARIGTIHNLCADILRAHPAEAGIDPRFDVLDETRSALMIRDAVEATLGWAVDQPDMAPLFGLLAEGQVQDLIKELLKQRQTVAAFVAAVPPETIRDWWQVQLAKAQAEELEQLLAHPDWLTAQRALYENESTNWDDKLAAWVLIARQALESLGGETTAGQIRNLAVLNEIKLTAGSAKVWPAGAEQKEAVKDALRTLRDMWQKRSILSAELNSQDDAVAAAMPAIYTLFATATSLYDTHKAELEALDFDDLETRAINLLATHPAVAAYWQEQVSALLVDEFQDTNEHQRGLVRLLCPEPGKLFIVGDAKQSIYRFRGADVSVFTHEKDRIAGDGGLLIDLDTSYRAHEQLLTAMNRLLRPVLGDDRPGLAPWVAPFAPLRAGRDRVPDGLDAPFVSFHLSVGNKAEALPVAAAALAGELIRLRTDSAITYGEVAILCRTTKAFQTYENALDKAGVPYVTVAGKGFYGRPEIRDLLNALAAIADPHDDLALVGLLRSPACGLADVTLYRIVRSRDRHGPSLWTLLQGSSLQTEQIVEDTAEIERLRAAVALIDDLNRQSGRISVADVLKQFLDRTHYRAILRRAGQPRALRNVSKLLLDIHTSELVSISRFLEYAQSLRDSGSREGEARTTGGDAVQIMTIHAAKGLEFPVVVLGDAAYAPPGRSHVRIDPQLGILLPQKNESDTQSTSYQMAKNRDEARDAAEANRLLYVALTRAEQLLIINGHVKQNKASFGAAGWLRQLGDITGLLNLDPGRFDGSGSSNHALDLQLESTPLRAVYYEPAYGPHEVAITETAPADLPDGPPPLLAPILVATSSDQPDDTPSRVWQVVAAQEQIRAPAWVIGQIVHEALALWRFPDADFNRWATARAREYGLTDNRQLQYAATEAEFLLQRFRRQALFEKMDTAEQRLHEVAYSYRVDGQLKTGYIDALFRHKDHWTLVDFKTDYLERDQTPNDVLDRTDYRQQVRGYGAAVRAMLSHTPRLLVCFLRAGDGQQVQTVAWDD